MITEVFDPLTGDKLDVYVVDNKTQEVNRVYPQKAIADIQRDYHIDESEAYRRLQNSDIENPVECDNVSYWVE